MRILIQSLTIFRMVAGPLIFICMIFYSLFEFAAIIFLLASVSDYLDGYFARKYHLESKLGAILDPIADKILLTFMFFSLTLSLESIFIGFAGSLILAREFWVGALREINASNHNIHATNVTMLAKIKTSAQFLTIMSYLVGIIFNSALILFLSNFLLTASLALTFKTGLTYTINTFSKT